VTVPELALTEADNRSTVDVQVGTQVSVRLPENPSTGYRWNADQVNDPLLSLAGSEFTQTAATGVGGAGTRTIRLVARAAGVAHLALKNKRSWEPDSAAVGQFDVTLNIS
jgi:inhibitor of cysteine peptidase